MNAPLIPQLAPMRIDRAGVYDLKPEVYHSDPTIEPSASASILKLGARYSAAHMRVAHPRLNPDFVREDKAKFDLGAAAHMLMLEGDEQFSRKTAVLDFDDYKKKDAQHQRDAAYVDGKTPLLAHQIEEVRTMVKAGREQIRALAEPEDRMAFQNGRPEQTLIWQEGETWCRALLDWMPLSGNVVHDYKTTAASANPDEWGQRALFEIGADIQSVFHSRGIRSVLSIPEPIFRFIVQENEPPYGLSVIQLSPEGVDSAERETMRALSLWRWCLRENRWPGYSPEVHHVSPPPWISYRREDRFVRERVMADLNPKERAFVEMLHQRLEQAS